LTCGLKNKSELKIELNSLNGNFFWRVDRNRNCNLLEKFI
jgi:hypothetical protein